MVICSPVKHREMLHDEVGNELASVYSDEQKTIVKTSTKLLLHKKLWEAEALDDQSGIRQAEAALNNHGFKRMKSRKLKKRELTVICTNRNQWSSFMEILKAK